jgi:hypothetical protein
VFTSARMVGRHDELSTATGLLERATAGEPGLGLVAGDVEVGETRFVPEVTARATTDGVSVLTGACVELSEGAAMLVPSRPCCGSWSAIAAMGSWRSCWRDHLEGWRRW